jgi:hypothetical protein
MAPMFGKLLNARMPNAEAMTKSECRIRDIHVIRGCSYIRVYSWLTKLERVVLNSRLCRQIFAPSTIRLPSSSGEADPSWCLR